MATLDERSPFGNINTKELFGAAEGESLYDTLNKLNPEDERVLSNTSATAGLNSLNVNDLPKRQAQDLLRLKANAMRKMRSADRPQDRDFGEKALENFRRGAFDDAANKVANSIRKIEDQATRDESRAKLDQVRSVYEQAIAQDPIEGENRFKGWVLDAAQSGEPMLQAIKREMMWGAAAIGVSFLASPVAGAGLRGALGAGRVGTALRVGSAAVRSGGKLKGALGAAEIGGGVATAIKAGGAAARLGRVAQTTLSPFGKSATGKMYTDNVDQFGHEATDDIVKFTGPLHGAIEGLLSPAAMLKPIGGVALAGTKRLFAKVMGDATKRTLARSVTGVAWRQLKNWQTENIEELAQGGTEGLTRAVVKARREYLDDLQQNISDEIADHAERSEEGQWLMEMYGAIRDNMDEILEEATSQYKDAAGATFIMTLAGLPANIIHEAAAEMDTRRHERGADLAGMQDQGARAKTANADEKLYRDLLDRGASKLEADAEYRKKAEELFIQRDPEGRLTTEERKSAIDSRLQAIREKVEGPSASTDSLFDSEPEIQKETEKATKSVVAEMATLEERAELGRLDDLEKDYQSAQKQILDDAAVSEKPKDLAKLQKAAQKVYETEIKRLGKLGQSEEQIEASLGSLDDINDKIEAEFPDTTDKETPTDETTEEEIDDTEKTEFDYNGAKARRWTDEQGVLHAQIQVKGGKWVDKGKASPVTTAAIADMNRFGEFTGEQQEVIDEYDRVAKLVKDTHDISIEAAAKPTALNLSANEDVVTDGVVAYDTARLQELVDRKKVIDGGIEKAVPEKNQKRHDELSKQLTVAHAELKRAKRDTLMTVDGERVNAQEHLQRTITSLEGKLAGLESGVVQETDQDDAINEALRAQADEEDLVEQKDSIGRVFKDDQERDAAIQKANKAIGVIGTANPSESVLFEGKVGKRKVSWVSGSPTGTAGAMSINRETGDVTIYMGEDARVTTPNHETVRHIGLMGLSEGELGALSEHFKIGETTDRNALEEAIAKQLDLRQVANPDAKLSGSIKRIFNKIMRFIKGLFGAAYARDFNELIDDIESGREAKKALKTEIPTQERQQRVIPEGIEEVDIDGKKLIARIVKEEEITFESGQKGTKTHTLQKKVDGEDVTHAVVRMEDGSNKLTIIGSQTQAMDEKRAERRRVEAEGKTPSARSNVSTGKLDVKSSRAFIEKIGEVITAPVEGIRRRLKAAKTDGKTVTLREIIQKGDVLTAEEQEVYDNALLDAARGAERSTTDPTAKTSKGVFKWAPKRGHLLKGLTAASSEKNQLALQQKINDALSDRKKLQRVKTVAQAEKSTDLPLEQLLDVLTIADAIPKTDRFVALVETDGEGMTLPEYKKLLALLNDDDVRTTLRDKLFEIDDAAKESAWQGNEAEASRLGAQSVDINEALEKDLSLRNTSEEVTIEHPLWPTDQTKTIAEWQSILKAMRGQRADFTGYIDYLNSLMAVKELQIRKELGLKESKVGRKADREKTDSKAEAAIKERLSQDEDVQAVKARIGEVLDGIRVQAEQSIKNNPLNTPEGSAAVKAILEAIEGNESLTSAEANTIIETDLANVTDSRRRDRIRVDIWRSISQEEVDFVTKGRRLRDDSFFDEERELGEGAAEAQASRGQIGQRSSPTIEDVQRREERGLAGRSAVSARPAPLERRTTPIKPDPVPPPIPEPDISVLPAAKAMAKRMYENVVAPRHDEKTGFKDYNRSSIDRNSVLVNGLIIKHGVNPSKEVIDKYLLDEATKQLSGREGLLRQGSAIGTIVKDADTLATVGNALADIYPPPADVLNRPIKWNFRFSDDRGSARGSLGSDSGFNVGGDTVDITVLRGLRPDDAGRKSADPPTLESEAVQGKIRDIIIHELTEAQHFDPQTHKRATRDLIGNTYDHPIAIKGIIAERIDAIDAIVSPDRLGKRRARQAELDRFDARRAKSTPKKTILRQQETAVGRTFLDEQERDAAVVASNKAMGVRGKFNPSENILFEGKSQNGRTITWSLENPTEAAGAMGIDEQGNVTIYLDRENARITTPNHESLRHLGLMGLSNGEINVLREHLGLERGENRVRDEEAIANALDNQQLQSPPASLSGSVRRVLRKVWRSIQNFVGATYNKTAEELIGGIESGEAAQAALRNDLEPTFRKQESTEETSIQKVLREQREKNPPPTEASKAITTDVKKNLPTYSPDSKPFTRGARAFFAYNETVDTILNKFSNKASDMYTRMSVEGQRRHTELFNDMRALQEKPSTIKAAQGVNLRNKIEIKDANGQAVKNGTVADSMTLGAYAEQARLHEVIPVFDRSGWKGVKEYVKANAKTKEEASGWLKQVHAFMGGTNDEHSSPDMRTKFYVDSTPYEFTARQMLEAYNKITPKERAWINEVFTPTMKTVRGRLFPEINRRTGETPTALEFFAPNRRHMSDKNLKPSQMPTTLWAMDLQGATKDRQYSKRPFNLVPIDELMYEHVEDAEQYLENDELYEEFSAAITDNKADLEHMLGKASVQQLELGVDRLRGMIDRTSIPFSQKLNKFVRRVIGVVLQNPVIWAYQYASVTAGAVSFGWNNLFKAFAGRATAGQTIKEIREIAKELDMRYERGGFESSITDFSDSRHKARYDKAYGKKGAKRALSTTAGKLTRPMSFVDKQALDTILMSAYHHGIEQGMSHSKAVEYAANAGSANIMRTQVNGNVAWQTGARASQNPLMRGITALTGATSQQFQFFDSAVSDVVSASKRGENVSQSTRQLVTATQAILVTSVMIAGIKALVPKPSDDEKKRKDKETLAQKWRWSFLESLSGMAPMGSMYTPVMLRNAARIANNKTRVKRYKYFSGSNIHGDVLGWGGTVVDGVSKLIAAANEPDAQKKQAQMDQAAKSLTRVGRNAVDVGIGINTRKMQETFNMFSKKE